MSAINMKNPALAYLWQQIVDMCKPYEKIMLKVKDEDGYHRLRTLSGRPFSAVAVQKKHVGLYMMALYEDSTLAGPLEGARIGKSCMGFRDENNPLLCEIPAYLERCLEHHVSRGEMNSPSD
jgi:hypothetical protein